MQSDICQSAEVEKVAINSNGVTYMKGYLQHAITFEKNVYIWSQAMRDINKRVERLYSERARLEAIKTATTRSLASLNNSNDALQKSKERDAVKYKKRSKTALIVMFVAMIILFGLGCGVGLLLINNPNTTLAVPKGAVIPILGIAFLVIGSLFTGIVPICLGVSIFSKNKSSSLENEARALSSRASQKRQEVLLKAQEDEAENDWIVNVIEESVISKEQDEIHKQLQIAQSNLNQIYGLNILPAKYRNLNAVATFYEYLATGRCNAIQGHGGIYDTYETERIQLAQLEQQVQMNATLSRMEDNQRMICQEMRQANQTLSGIRSHLSEIEKTNAEIAHNTAISAAADQQTAAAAQWMAWRTWANGY